MKDGMEFYADFVAGDPYHFTLNMPSNHLYMLPAVVDPSALRWCFWLSNVDLSSDTRGPLIPQKGLHTKQLRDDPVTPLLNQWTYQAMVHELIGLQDNKVDLRAIESLPKDQQVEAVLSSEQDAFFKSNMYENFGDIGMNIKRMVDDFQQVSNVSIRVFAIRAASERSVSRGDDRFNLRYQLANPRFGEHHLAIYLTSFSEFYADFVAGDPISFHIEYAVKPPIYDPSSCRSLWFAAVFLALKRRPVIRYQRTSDTAKRIAHETAKLMYQHESALFDFRRTESSPLLLVIDRRDDPAMVHELIGLEDNKEVVLSSEQDAFFKSNMYLGILEMNIKRMVEDMARFVDNYPEYKKMQGNVSKHVTLVTEMSKLVEARKLMTVSQTEQDLACNGGQGAAYEAVTDLLNNESVSDIDRLRLVMLYALRYEKENPVQLMQLFNKLASRSPKYKPGVMSNLALFSLNCISFLYL
ncbi:hypothetical protein DY000_02062292 [Brassica cretica]|uniref:Uncharacterized protein n=1 Tax=Brassica cretica TaxID=69181 RepID=A0ABQ7B2U7_BRACR|nr:hypothetical protein DY000_02062292 [Brassica cretica]